MAVARDSNTSTQLQKLRSKIKREEKRKMGIITYFNEWKKYGFIEGEGFNCIFFPDCLSWYCRDIKSLENQEVSFIPIRDKKRDHSEGYKAIDINLI